MSAALTLPTLDGLFIDGQWSASVHLRVINPARSPADHGEGR
jgi:hypothetical protein